MPARAAHATYLTLWAFAACVTAVPAAACEPGQEAGQTASAIGAQGTSQTGVVTDFQDRVLSQAGSQEGTAAALLLDFPPDVSGRPGMTPM